MPKSLKIQERLGLYRRDALGTKVARYPMFVYAGYIREILFRPQLHLLL